MHPDGDELAAFGLGKLDDDTHQRVERHVAQCDSCCEFLQALPGDTIVSLLRDPDAETSVSPDRAAGAAPTIDSADQLQGPRGAEPTISPELPEALCDHPKYQIIRLLGHGGMGNVYLAEHRLMHRQVAVKVINRDLVDSPAAVERFRREVRAAARLDHPNIVTAHDADEAGDLLLLVMEYVPGSTLHAEVKQHGPLPVERACGFVQQAAAGLQHAHQAGIVHRDVKPQNLILTPDGRVKILDVGLAGLVEAAMGDASLHAAPAAPPPSATLTAHGSMMGTPDYIAPEQARDARSADARADIYSLGCTLYFLLSGQPPFADGSAIDKVQAHQERAAAPLTELRSDVPGELDATVRRMMAKSPDDRFQDLGQVAAAMTTWAGDELLRKLEAHGRQSRRWKTAAAVAAALLVVVAAMGTLAYRSATDFGQLRLSADQPGVRVLVRRNGDDIAILDADQHRVLRVESGNYQLALATPDDSLVLATPANVDVTRKATVEVRVRPLTSQEAAERAQRRAAKRGEQYDKLVADVNAVRTDDPLEREVESLRQQLVAFRAEHAGTDEALTAARLMAKLPWPADALDRRRIAAEELEAAGHGDPQAAPPELVAVFGSSRFRWWSYGGYNEIAASPDGQWLSATGGSRIQVWSRSDGRLRTFAALPEPQKETCLAFHPHQPSLLSGGDDGGVRLWKLDDAEMHTLPGKHSGPVRSVSFDDDGQLLASAALDGIVIRRASSGGIVADLRGRLGDPDPGAISRCAFLPRSRTLAAVSQTGAVLLVDTPTWEVSSRIQADFEHVGRMGLSPLGTTIAIAGRRDARRWAVDLLDVKSLEIQNALPAMPVKAVTDVVFPADGRSLWMGIRHGPVLVWDTESRQRTDLVASDAWENQIAFINDEKIFVTTDNGCGLWLWERASMELLNQESGTTNPPQVVVSPDGRTVTCSGWVPTAKRQEGTYQVQRYSLETGQRLSSVDADYCLLDVAVSDLYVSAMNLTMPGSFAIRDTTGKIRAPLKAAVRSSRQHAHWYGWKSAVIDPGGANLAIGGPDGEVSLWEVASGRLLQRKQGHSGVVRTLAFSPDGSKLVTGGSDFRIRLWEVGSLELVGNISAGAKSVRDVAISPRGEQLAAAVGTAVQLRSMDSGELQQTLFDGKQEARSVAFSPAGDKLAAVMVDGVVRVWDRRRSDLLHEVVLNEAWSHQGDIQFTPDGRHLVTANGNGTVYVLRLENRKQR